MSTMTAAPTPATTTQDRPDVTWRDAATPLSQASRQRWTACYVLLLALLAAGIVDDTFAVAGDRWRRDGDGDIPLIMLISIPVVFGMLRRGTRRITALDHPELDERDINTRNSAYRVAFPLLVLAVLVGLALVVAFGIDETETRTRVGGSAVLIESIPTIDRWALIGLGLWIALWAAFLPTGALAWREPDALELDEGGGFSESIRDSVLGVALATALAISLIADADAPALLFVAAVAFVSALGRRAAGQPVMSRQRKWRVAIGLALLVLLIALVWVLGSVAANDA